MMKNSPIYDVAIVGGGPSGATAGTQLAKAGQRVIILEKEAFPRFAIGESLLPRGNDILRQIGVWPKLEQAGFLRKYGAEFCTGDGARLQRFWFGKNMGSSHEYSYQVERSQFDQILLEHAREQGCEVREQTRITQLENPNNEVMTLHGMGPEGSLEIKTRWIIDASGRAAFSGKRIGLQRRDTLATRRIAIYGHFEGVFRNSGKAEGHITIARTTQGWFWLIPLAGGRTSVGLVLPSEEARIGSERRIENLFAEAVQSTPEVRERLHSAKLLTSLRSTGDYSWKFSHFATRRILLTGDAAGFVDPIFSSGVMLALKSAIRASELILQASATKRSLTRWECFSYTRQVTRWMTQYTQIIRSFYDRAGFEVFMNPSPFFQIPGSIGRLVGGETEPGFSDRLRLTAFHLLCRIQRMVTLAPAIRSLR
jgi:flavin-dependent dehydrogenase